MRGSIGRKDLMYDPHFPNLPRPFTFVQHNLYSISWLWEFTEWLGFCQSRLKIVLGSQDIKNCSALASLSICQPRLVSLQEAEQINRRIVVSWAVANRLYVLLIT